MDQLASLIEALGLTPADGAESVTFAQVVEALASADVSRETHGVARDAFVALRTAAAADGTVSVADLTSLGDAVTSFGERIVASEAAGDLADVVELPEPAATPAAESAEAEQADGTEAEPDAEQTADTEPEAIAASVVTTRPRSVPGSAAPVVAPDEPSFQIGAYGNTSQRPMSELADALGQNVRGGAMLSLPVDVGIRSDPAPDASVIAAAICDGGGSYGFCGFPTLVDEVEVCGTAEWPEAAAFIAGPESATGQAMLRRPPIGVVDAGFRWTSEDAASQILRDENGDPIPDARGNPQVNPDAAEKDCVPVVRGDMELWQKTTYGQCRIVPFDIDPSQLAAVVESIGISNVRNSARMALSFMAGSAMWVAESDESYARTVGNAGARVAETLLNAAHRLAASQGVTQVATDLFVPAWLPSAIVGEGFNRPDIADIWAEVTMRLTAAGVTIRPSLDFFVDDPDFGDVATQLVNANASTWELQPVTGGTIAAPDPIADLATSVPMLLAESGSVQVDVRPVLDVNMTGTPQPVGRTDVVRNSRTIFSEMQMQLALRGCSPIVGTVVCLDPTGTTAEAAARPTTCPVP